MASIFTKIVNREIPAYIVAEDERFLAFLDIRPMMKGHTLVIPKKEVDYIFDLDDETLGPLMVFAKKVAAALEQAVPCKRIGIAVAGLEVPHAHVHLMPMQSVGDIGFHRTPLEMSPEEMQALAEDIKSRL